MQCDSTLSVRYRCLPISTGRWAHLARSLIHRAAGNARTLGRKLFLARIGRPVQSPPFVFLHIFTLKLHRSSYCRQQFTNHLRTVLENMADVDYAPPPMAQPDMVKQGFLHRARPAMIAIDDVPEYRVSVTRETEGFRVFLHEQLQCHV